MKVFALARFAARRSVSIHVALGLIGLLFATPASSAAHPGSSPSIPDPASQSSDRTAVGVGPTITLQIVAGTGGMYHLKGHVTANGPIAGLPVRFGGGPECVQGKATTTDANGDFDLVVDPASGDEGQVWAQTMDSNGLVSDLATQYLLL